MKTKAILTCSLLGWLLVSCDITFAGWGNPVVVVNGGIGVGANDFSLGIGDSTIEFSIVTDVSSGGEIAISDEGNGRVKIYHADGSLKHLLVPPVSNPRLWTYQPKFINQNVVIPIATFYFYSASGSLLKEHPYSGSGSSLFHAEINGEWYLALETGGIRRWLEFSSVGELLATHTEKPLTMGRHKKSIIIYQGQTFTKTTIAYPEMNWVRVDKDDGCTEYDYIRDSGGSVYCKYQVVRRIKRFNACGRSVTDLTLPEDDLELEGSGAPGVEPFLRKINALYGDIILADNGDLYSSRVSDTSYQVLRWPWQASANDRNDGPFAPELLTMKLAGNAATLSWKLSPHDGGCVTGYEVGRSTTAGGPYTALATMPAATNAYMDNTLSPATTYYYRVRALSAIANSDYSNEVMVALP